MINFILLALAYGAASAVACGLVVNSFGRR